MSLKTLIYLLIVLPFAGSGCNFLKPPKDGERYFVLTPASCERQQGNNKSKLTILVEEPEIHPGIEVRRIVFARDSRERGFYQYAFWFYPVNLMLKDILSSYLNCSGPINILQDSLNLEPADFILQMRLIDLMHNISSFPGEAQVELRIKLISAGTKQIVSQETFTQKIPVSAYNSEGAVKALNQAVNNIAEQVSSWIKEYLK